MSAGTELTITMVKCVPSQLGTPLLLGRSLWQAKRLWVMLKWLQLQAMRQLQQEMLHSLVRLRARGTDHKGGTSFIGTAAETSVSQLLEYINWHH